MDFNTNSLHAEPAATPAVMPCAAVVCFLVGDAEKLQTSCRAPISHAVGDSLAYPVAGRVRFFAPDDQRLRTACEHHAHTNSADGTPEEIKPPRKKPFERLFGIKPQLTKSKTQTSVR